MHRINNKHYPIRDWEKAIVGRDDVEFEAFELHAGVVSRARGIVRRNNREYKVVWFADGHCYWNDRRAKNHDIKF